MPLRTLRLPARNSPISGSSWAGRDPRSSPRRPSSTWRNSHAQFREVLMRATFVLVHGAWFGGWCWKKVTPRLRAAGHDVFAATLTGLGERAHLLTPDVGLDTHIEDILAVLEFENLTNVVLVGHSYAGMVIAGVAQ